MPNPMDEAKRLGLAPIPQQSQGPDPMAEAQRMGLTELPGQGEAAVRGAVQGFTLDYGDEAGGGLQAVIDHVTGNAGNEAFADTYRKRRDEIRARNNAAKEAYPGTYLAGQIGGGLLLPIPGGGLVKTAGTMAALGGAAAVGANEDPSQLGQDIVTGVAGGAAAGAGGYALGKLATTPAIVEGMDRLGLHMGRTHLQGATTPFTGGNIRNPISDEAVRAANEAGAFGGRSIYATEKVLDKAGKAAGEKLGNFVESATEQGVKGGINGETSARLRQMANDIESKTVGDPRPKLLRERADEIDRLLPQYVEPNAAANAEASAAYQQDHAAWQQKYDSVIKQFGQPRGAAGAARVEQLAREFAGPEPLPPGLEHGPYPHDDRLPLDRAESVKSSAQDNGRFEKFAPDRKLQGEQDIAREVNASNESAVAQQMGMDKLQQFKDLKGGYGALEEARAAAERGAAMWENRPPVGVIEAVTGAMGHLPAAVAIHLGKTRGYGAAATGLLGLSARLRAVARTAPAALGRYAGIFQRAATDDEAAKQHFVLNATDPQYRQLVRGLNQGSGDGGQ